MSFGRQVSSVFEVVFNFEVVFIFGVIFMFEDNLKWFIELVILVPRSLLKSYKALVHIMEVEYWDVINEVWSCLFCSEQSQVRRYSRWHFQCNIVSPKVWEMRKFQDQNPHLTLHSCLTFPPISFLLINGNWMMEEISTHSCVSGWN